MEWHGWRGEDTLMDRCLFVCFFSRLYRIKKVHVEDDSDELIP